MAIHRGLSSDTGQIVTFRLGAEFYGVDIMKVKEIILIGKITRIPQVDAHIEGATNLRGQVIPVIDLRKRLALPAVERTEESRIMVLNLEGRTSGIIVDSVCEVLRYNSAELEATPASIQGGARDYLKGLLKKGDRLMVLLDIEKLLNEKPTAEANQAKAA